MGACLCRELAAAHDSQTLRRLTKPPEAPDVGHAAVEGGAPPGGAVDLVNAAAAKQQQQLSSGGAKAGAVGLGDVVLDEGAPAGGTWTIGAARPPEAAGGAGEAANAAAPSGAAETTAAAAAAPQRVGVRFAPTPPSEKRRQKQKQLEQQAKAAAAAAAAAAAHLPAASPAPASTSAAAAGSDPVASRRISRRFKDCYKVGETLGKGGFAVVKRVTERATGRPYAVKIMSLPPLGAEPADNESTREDIFKEIDILCGLDHENVVALKEYFEEGNKVYLICELVTGGELLEAVVQKGAYTEAEARACFAQLLRGIAYLHSRGVAHRDLKLENLLLAAPGDLARVKIADFGLAKRAAPSGPGGAATMSTVCGTPQYVAPEVIKGTTAVTYGPQVDMWSAGVVLFILLAGYPPFYSESEPALFDQIRRGAFSFDDPAWDAVSSLAKDMVRALLSVDPAQRPTAAQCLEHPWLRAAAAGAPAGGGPELVGAHARLRAAWAASMGGEGFAAAMVAERSRRAGGLGGSGDEYGPTA